MNRCVPLTTLFFALLLAFSSRVDGNAADRVALIIGVDQYDNLPKQSQLKVAVSDARKMADTLRKTDPPFDVRLLTDVEQDDAEDAFDDFLGKAKNAECAFLYFAGHGVEYFGTNYLIVRDTDVSSISADVNRMKRRLGNEALSLQELVDSLDTTKAKIKLVVLDCCRDNPLEAEDGSGTRSVVGGKSGLAQVTPPSGTLISYSADAGQRANDGLFTEVLANEIAHSGLPILRVFASTREKVRKISTEWAEEDAAKGIPSEFRRVRHEPAEYNKLDLAGLDFTFNRGIPAATKISQEQAEKVAALENQIAAMQEVIARLEAAGAGNKVLRDQLETMEASLETEKVEAKEDSVGAQPTMERTESKAKGAGIGGTISFGTSAKAKDSENAPPMAVTKPAEKPAFSANRSMEGSRAGETRSFAGIEFVWCPPTGEEGYLMGSPEGAYTDGSDEMQHAAVLTKGFWMAKTECTQEQWASVVGRNPSKLTGVYNRPVESVSWEDVQGWLARRNESHPLPNGWLWKLPTEAQWEYACRAGTNTVFSFGDSLGSHQANFDGNDPFGGGKKGKWLERIAEVGGYPANAWGLLDMHGNVWEWCSDWYSDTYYRDGQIDPAGPSEGADRVIRGGGWNYGGSSCRSANRNNVSPGSGYGYLGFRPAIAFGGPKWKEDSDPISIRVTKEKSMAVTMPENKVAFPAGSDMQGSRAGEVREFAGIEFVWCPPGEHKKEVGLRFFAREKKKGFWMAKTECTQSQWEGVMGSNPSEFRGSNHPVEQVSWNDCKGWLSKMNQAYPPPEGWEWALPSNDQWEYACRADSDFAFSFGDDESQLENFGNFADRNVSRPWVDKNQDDGVGESTAQVGSYKPNSWGLYDMHGNVAEWCEDGGFARLGNSGLEKTQIAVFRGGSWLDVASECSVVSEGRSNASEGSRQIGFRPCLLEKADK